MLFGQNSHEFKKNDFAFNLINIKWDHTEEKILRIILPNIIGEKRYQRILQRKYVQKQNEKSLKWVKALLIGMADIRIEDILELFAEIKNSAVHKRIRFLTISDSVNVRALLKPYDTEKKLPKAVVDVLINILVPVNSLDDIFLNEQKPVIENNCVHSGDSLEAVSRLVLYANYIRLAADLSLPEYWLLLGKRIIDREPQVGMVIPHLEGYHCVSKIISADHARTVKDFFRGGAYIVALEPLSSITDNFSHMLFCRGTRPPVMATSGIRTWADNLRACQGADGIMLDFPVVQKLLSTPRWKGKRLHIGGMSLGSAHAQRLCLALLITKIAVESLTLVSGVGIEKFCLELYKTLPIERKLKKIRLLTEMKDPVSLLGGGHLGADDPNQDIDFYCVTSKDQSDSPDIFLKDYAELHPFQENHHFSNMKRFFYGLKGIHSTYRLWYEDETLMKIQYFNRQTHPEVITWVMDNSIGNKKYLEMSRQYFLPAKHHNKFFDFLVSLVGKPALECLDALDNPEMVQRYQENQRQFFLNAFTMLPWSANRVIEPNSENENDVHIDMPDEKEEGNQNKVQKHN